MTVILAVKLRKKFGRSSEEVRDNHISEASNTQKMILDYLASNPSMTAADLSLKTGLSSRAIEKNIKKLKDCGLLICHGSTKAGYWEVLSEEK